MDNKEIEKQFPISEYKKQTFQFTREELMRVISLETVIQTAIITQRTAEDYKNRIFNMICLPRVGAKPEGAGITYDTNAGAFHVYVPRARRGEKKLAKVGDSTGTDAPKQG